MVIDDLANCLNAKQREICLSQDNYLIMACPGIVAQLSRQKSKIFIMN